MGSMNFCIPEYLLVGQLLHHDPCMRAYTCYDEGDYSACKSKPNPAAPRSSPSGSVKPRSPGPRPALNLCPIEEEEEAAVADGVEDPAKVCSPSATVASCSVVATSFTAPKQA